MKQFGLFILIVIMGSIGLGAAAQDYPARRQKAAKLQKDGNIKEAYDIYHKLVLDPGNQPEQVKFDFNNAYNCLYRLNRATELDAFREAAVKTHAENWRLLQTVAQNYLNDRYHYGFMVAGEFQRGPKRGGRGKVVNSYDRDRVRSLQLMAQALPLAEAGGNVYEHASFYGNFARMMLANRGYQEAWRLQYKTDLSKLPDYEEGYYRGYYYRRSQAAAPVDEKGNPVFHKAPKGFAAAQSDGERWRFLLMMTMELGPNYKRQVMRQYADFLYNQFGVQTMQRYGYGYYRRQPAGKDETKRQGGILALHTLTDDETVARLATGTKRFKLPAEHNFIKIYQQLADNRNISAMQVLAQIYQNRRQYPKAAREWRRYLAITPRKWVTRQLEQIVNNWGMFETGKPRPAGTKATLAYRFRNGTKVSFTAHKIKVDKLLADVKAYLRANPKRLDRNQVNISSIGYRLVRENQAKYIGDKKAEWPLELEPRPKHFDKRITVATPLREPGAYLVTAKLKDGNTSRIIVWLTDMVVACKRMKNQTWYYLADAVSGKPIAKAELEFFGYRQEWVGKRITRKITGRQYNVYTREFAKITDANGQVFVSAKDTVEERGGRSYSFQWMVIAQRDKRRAYLGFRSIWYSGYYDHQYNQRKTYVITDRPVYRPGQKVKFKVWTGHVRYDLDQRSPYANRGFVLRINNPKGEKVFDKNFTSDEYGGFDGEFALPKDATLGRYYIHLPHWGGGLQFRVEEYKKPEFEVTIEAPKEPVMLGEKIPVKIRAKYYFGAPVVNAKVKLKVKRNNYSANWYPRADWDWFYGPGYWWYAYDYPWYPGWRKWGCWRPIPWWWRRGSTPPELVMDREARIGPDGTVEINIDSAIAKELHGDTDHRYQITAEVTDESRRTIVGSGQVLVARAPFKVYVWLDRGYYNVGDNVNASVFAQTLDSKPVKGKGILKLLKVTYDKQNRPRERIVRFWRLDSNEEGRARLKLKASKPGQYRVSYTVTDSKGHRVEGGYVFIVRGRGFDGSRFRFSKLELIPEKREYRPGEKVKLMINADKRGATVLLFLRPAGSYLPPKFIGLKGKSALEQVAVTKKDMPNFFIEALTVYDGEIHTAVKEIVVPPEKRVLNVSITPSAKSYKPGAKAKVKLRLTDFFGEPFVGSLALSIYDKAVEYISGGPNVPEIKSFFWKWRRHHYPQTWSNLQRGFGNLLKHGEIGMNFLGAFGHGVTELSSQRELRASLGKGGGRRRAGTPAPRAAKSAAFEADSVGKEEAEGMVEKKRAEKDKAGNGFGGAGAAEQFLEATVRKDFADSAYWNGSLTTDARGETEIELKMPENLTSWKIRTWAMGRGTRVGEAAIEVVTTKNLLLRLQAPRFFVEKDEVVLSANVHNYLKTEKKVKVILEINDVLSPMKDNLTQLITVKANGEKRVDWRVKVVKEGSALVRMKALTDEESDAMQMRFPAKVHGMLKMVSFSGHMRPDKSSARIVFKVPRERRVDESVLEVRYSPTLAGAMVDALPYLVSYPYGCTEQTLNKFVPTVIVQKILIDMGLDLAAIREKRTNLNAQEIGDDKTRAAQWKRGHITGYDAEGRPIWSTNPVFDLDTVRDMVKLGVIRLTNMQLSDGGWGWFSGWREHSYPHTTATVVHGLQTARQNDVLIPPTVLARGIGWLERYQARQVQLLKNAATETKPWKNSANNLDALVFMVLVDEKVKNQDMLEFLYRDRNHLAVYGKCMLGMALHKLGEKEKVAMIRRNIEQFLVKDKENQTAYLKLGNGGYWWYWYGSEYEAHAYYLKLLARLDPKGETAPWLVKYLLNNRRHATYWNSTRDTAVCIEAMADYMRASKEDKPDMTLEVYLDGKKHKEVKINQDNIFSFDNKFLLAGTDVTTGTHTLEFRRKGRGPLYFNAYLTYFSLEDHITRAGLEVKVNRKYFKLTEVEKKIKVAGARGQALDQRVEKYKRDELPNLGRLKSGDLVEIELTIESKNDYEYLIFEDMKAAGFEPFKVRSGYHKNGMGAYMELRDDRIAFFVRWLPRGKHSISYRMRAEIPGKFSALPAKAYAMYAPELKGNSDEIKLHIDDVDLTLNSEKE